MATIPTLETERLILRAHTVADFDRYAEMWVEPDVVRFIGGAPFSREDSWSRFLRHAGVWHHMGFGFFAIEEKETGHFVGEAGFHDLHRTMQPSNGTSISADEINRSSYADSMLRRVRRFRLSSQIRTAVLNWSRLDGASFHIGGRKRNLPITRS